MKTDLTVAGYIIFKDKVLLIHHRKLDLWLPVGGHIDKDETPDEALIREIKEEVNINIIILNKSNISVEGNTKTNLAIPFYVNLHSVGDHDHVGFYYLCEAMNVEQLNINKELKNYKWFTKEELNQKHIPIDVKNQASKAFKLYESLSK